MSFIYQLVQDIKLLFFTNTMLMFFRILFIAVFFNQLNSASQGEIPMALWYGLRISLKTTGCLVAFTFLFATLPKSFCRKWPADIIRKYFGYLCIFLFTFLFMARIPYYTIYTQGFNAMLINGAKDDTTAILKTALDQYQLLPRCAGVLLIALILIYLWNKLLQYPLWQPKGNPKFYIISFIILLPAIFLLLRFGGGYSFDTGIHWESAARTKSNLLNEAILDDGQALYRVYSIYERSHNTKAIKITVAEAKKALEILGGPKDCSTISQGLKRTSLGNTLSTKPNQVVLILGENYALWPLLPQYRNLGLCPTGEKLEKEGAYTYNFLANGNGTMTSLNGFISGMVDTGLYPNYMSTAKNKNYATGIGTIMKNAGYYTVFWYGGQSSWQNIGNYALEQGFDDFKSADKFDGVVTINTWGIPDADLFAEIEKYMQTHSEPTFHFILTTSNHPPYALDVNSLGFPSAKVAASLPDTITNSPDIMKQLGHIWYADIEMGKFIDKVQQHDPKSLFIVTGDHAERFSFAKEVGLEELDGIPCYFYGNGITKTTFSPAVAGSHVQIIPTLAELLLPKGETYYSLLPPLQTSKKAFNYKLVISAGKMSLEKDSQDKDYKDIIKAARVVSIRRMMDGNKLQ